MARASSLALLAPLLLFFCAKQAAAIKLFVDKVECMTKEVHDDEDQITGSFVGVPGTSSLWSGRKTTFNLEVKRPDGTLIHSIFDKQESDFQFLAHSAGRYEFCLRSLSPGIKEVLWELHIGHVITHEKALAEHVDEVSEIISQLSEHLEEIRQRTHYYRNRDEVHLSTMKSTDLRIALTAFLEAVFLVATCAVQIFFVRRMFDKKVAALVR